MSTPRCYAGRILRVDLSSGQIDQTPLSDYLSFVGGRGLGGKIYWDEVAPTVGPFDPQNELIFATGPLTGFAGFGSSRWQVYGKSPISDRQGFSYCNLGGTWGVALKTAGFDALVVRGQAPHPVTLVIEGGTARLAEASGLIGKGAIQTRASLKSRFGDSASVVAIGPAGENRVALATILADQDSSGGSGFGAVMGAKGLKAIVAVKGSHRLSTAHPDRVQEIVKLRKKLAGSDAKLTNPVPTTSNMRKDYCWGCPGPCIRYVYQAADGTEGKFMCQDANFYLRYARPYYEGKFGDVPFVATHLCNEYGLDTMGMSVMVNWLGRCHNAGILGDSDMGVPVSSFGSGEYVNNLLQKVAFREGIGDLLADGTAAAASALGPEAARLVADIVHKAEANDTYGPRIYLANALVYVIEPRQAKQILHETSFVVDRWVEKMNGRPDSFVTGATVVGVARRFWGGEAAADMTAYEGKALASKLILDRNHAKDCLILCDMMWPVYVSRHTPDGVGDPSLESRLFSAVTGWQTNEEELLRLGANSVALQRAITIREGHRGKADDSLPEFCFSTPLMTHNVNVDMLVPGPGGRRSQRKGAVVDRQAFEAMRAEFYRLQGWDANGIPPANEVVDRGILPALASAPQ